jgi:23S rRNA pseudouridine1911/1915/1917 synthase
VIRRVVMPWQAGRRLDQVLPELAPISRRQARVQASAGEIAKNGRVTKMLGNPVEAGDVLELRALSPGPELPTLPVLPPLRRIHQDRHLVAVDKPAGMLSQPAEQRTDHELACDELLLLHLALSEGHRPYLHLAHRLDRATSGLLLFSRDPSANAPLAEAWRQGTVERCYVAVVEGEPDFETTVVAAPIARDLAAGWRFEVSPWGSPARTEVRVLRSDLGRAVVECRLDTGRTHQVRVHLAHLGLPVAGDTLYGGSATAAARPLLHALSLTLPHPAHGRRLALRAPLPHDMAPHFARLEGYSAISQS